MPNNTPRATFCYILDIITQRNDSTNQCYTLVMDQPEMAIPPIIIDASSIKPLKTMSHHGSPMQPRIHTAQPSTGSTASQKQIAV